MYKLLLMFLCFYMHYLSGNQEVKAGNASSLACSLSAASGVEGLFGLLLLLLGPFCLQTAASSLLAAPELISSIPGSPQMTFLVAVG